MDVNKYMSSVGMPEKEDVLHRESIKESICVLKNLHHSMQQIFKKIGEQGKLEDSGMLEIMQDEITLMEEELSRLCDLAKAL